MLQPEVSGCRQQRSSHLSVLDRYFDVMQMSALNPAAWYQTKRSGSVETWQLSQLF